MKQHTEALKAHHVLESEESYKLYEKCYRKGLCKNTNLQII